MGKLEHIQQIRWRIRRQIGDQIYGQIDRQIVGQIQQIDKQILWRMKGLIEEQIVAANKNLRKQR